MLQRLNDNVYWGDWKSPVEAVGKVQSVFNVAHSFSRRRGRNLYWSELEKIDWRTFYVRLSLKDAMEASPDYCRALEQAALTAKALGKLPILCHCQMGGHRGPSSAVLVSWVLGGKTRYAFEQALAGVLSVKPGFGTGRNNGYYGSVMRHCRDNSLEG
jgi:hypothetical protein